jgi:hypothetical protein
MADRGVRARIKTTVIKEDGLSLHAILLWLFQANNSLQARIETLGEGKESIKARLKKLNTENASFLSRILTTKIKSLEARGFIVDIGKTYLYAPPTGSYSNIPVAFKWYIPSNRWGKDMSFEIQIDKTNDTFNDLEADVFSFSNPGMEYFDGANWNSISSTGVPSTYSGNLARFITNLTNGLKYWRVRAFVG